jgi:signal transduction histidine kinase
VASAVGGVALRAVNSDVDRGTPSFWQLGLVAAIAYGGTGGWLVRLRPGLVVGWVMAGIGLGQGLSLLALEYGVHALVVRPGLPLGEAALWVGSWLWAPSYVAIPLVLLQLLPDGSPLGGRWRLALALGAVVTALVAVGWALTPYDLQDFPLEIGDATNPVGVAAVATRPVSLVGPVLILGTAVLSVSTLVVRWRRSRGAGVARQRLKWVLLGVALTLLLLVTAFAVPDDVGGYLVGLAMLPLPAACLLAVARFGLWDVDLVINRSLVYAALTGVVVALYVLVVGLLGGVAGRSTGAPIVATALVAVLAQPLHLRLQRAVNRLVHGDVQDPYAALARLGAQLEAARDPAAVGEQVLPEVLAATARVLRVPTELVLRDGTRVSAGDPGPEAEEVPLGYAGETLGKLRVGLRPGGLSRSERRLLDGLSRQAAVAVHGLLLGRDLQHSRELLVSAREEERRRLRRDLHDGVGPALAAAALQVETAREVYGRDPEAAGTLLDRAALRLRGAVDDVRTVVHGLRPATLDDLGLAGALVELSGRFDGPGRSVTARVTEVPGRSAAVDAAVYLVAAEAVTNAARHSGAGRVEVVLCPAPDGLVLTVTDDGAGLPVAPRLGLGLGSMRERAEELGGTLSVGEGPDGSGTTVTMRLPLEVGT